MAPSVHARLAIIRHGPTEWNAEGRIQGHTDIPLSAAGRAAVAGWRVPGELAGFRWLASPLKRALETARLLGAEPAIEPRLAEMNYGQWEGHRIDDLRAEQGDAMAENERRGLDMRPPGGESPRDLQQRLKPWLSEVGALGEPTVAVAHNGVLRAVYSLASGWDMKDKPANKLKPACAHLFRVDTGGEPTIERLKIPLDDRRDGR